MSTQSNKLLSDITVYGKYAKWLPGEKRKETYEEIVDRNLQMHRDHYGNKINVLRMQEIEDAYNLVQLKEILPSMRSMQFGGYAIERNPARIYNCAYLPISEIDAFSETMFLLLSGTGVGYSVQYRHVNKLPKVIGPGEDYRRYVVGDSIEGWADAIKVLVESYFLGKDRIRFDLSDIRPKGTQLVISGGKAPGPDPLRICLVVIESLLSQCIGRRMTPLEAHDIQCHIADAVLSGGIRRAAMIALFSSSDYEMMTAKSGWWWEANPQRGRANNSVILHRGSTTYEEYKEVWDRIQNSGAGEPGIYWTNDYELGTNPCCEISLRPFQFCNLTEINASTVVDQEDFNKRAEAASLIGTLQAGYTDFHYLRPIWRKTTEQDALIGVGITGIASGTLDKLNLEEAANVVVETNKRVSKQLGIRSAARCTTVKPSGTSSLVCGSSSGIHAWHSLWYARRIRLGKDEALAKYLQEHFPALVEQDYEKANGLVITFPQEAPEDAAFRTESALDLLTRVSRFNQEWVARGHIKGKNKNNVSCTVSIRPNEWNEVGQWLWDNKDSYNGMATLPYDGGTYVQAPFESISEDYFKELESHLHAIDLTKIKEVSDNTDLSGELACAGGVCEI